jgi:DNA-binding MarR family transcriptional regulator
MHYMVTIVTKSRYRPIIEVEYQLLKTVKEFDEINIGTTLHHIQITDGKRLHKILDPLIEKGFLTMHNYKNIEGGRHKVLKITEKGLQHLEIIKQYLNSGNEQQQQQQQ